MTEAARDHRWTVVDYEGPYNRACPDCDARYVDTSDPCIHGCWISIASCPTCRARGYRRGDKVSQRHRREGYGGSRADAG